MITKEKLTIEKIQSQYDYYKVHAVNKQGYKTVRVKKDNQWCLWCGSSNCKHITGKMDNNEMINIIYDTLMNNKQYPQFNSNLVNDCYIDNDKNRIFFTYNGKAYYLTMED